MKSYEEYVKLRERAAADSLNSPTGKPDRKLMADKAQAFNAYRAEVRAEAKRGNYIKEGKPVMVRRDGELVAKSGSTKKSLQEEYVRKLSDQSQPKTATNPKGLSPRTIARERLGV